MPFSFLVSFSTALGVGGGVGWECGSVGIWGDVGDCNWPPMHEVHFSPLIYKLQLLEPHDLTFCFLGHIIMSFTDKS